jgi:uncharacterized protein GlcG (DUF336 family)
MRRLTVMAGALCVALVTAPGAFAQVPPDPNNPNENVPDQMNPPEYGESINIETAKKVAAAAVAELQKRNWKGMCIAVVARTAARYRRSTVVFERLIGKGSFFAYLPTLDDVIASRGGNPLVAGGKVIGAIGVSGGTGSQDDVISNAGVAALK